MHSATWQLCLDDGGVVTHRDMEEERVLLAYTDSVSVVYNWLANGSRNPFTQSGSLALPASKVLRERRWRRYVEERIS